MMQVIRKHFEIFMWDRRFHNYPDIFDTIERYLYSCQLLPFKQKR